jgi:hypothetical protein
MEFEMVGPTARVTPLGVSNAPNAGPPKMVPNAVFVPTSMIETSWLPAFVTKRRTGPTESGWSEAMSTGPDPTVIGLPASSA